jgi:predicted regulator of Ras-like GTPase activity (Roadblock/LC7/MglB family)
MSYSKDEKILKKILKAIINSTAGLKYAIIIDDTGITILSESKFRTSDDNISVEKIGAIGGAVFIAGEEQGQILGYGKIRVQITEYQEGMIFSVKVGRGVLCIASDTNVQIGFVRAILKKWAPKIALILERYLKSDQEAINKELKELFNSDTVSLL